MAWRGGQTSGVVSSGLGKQNWFHAFVADGWGRAADKRVAIVIHMMGETMTIRQSACF